VTITQTSTLNAASTLDVLPDVSADLLFRQAQTANAFTDQPVTEAELRQIYDLVKWGPTAMNSQPLRIAWVTTPEAHDRLVPLMSPGNRTKTAQAPVVAVVAADLHFHENLPTTFPHVPGMKDSFADEDMRRGISQMNAAIQLGYLIVAVRAAGLAAGPMGGLDHEAAAAEFFPGGRHVVLAAVNIGHPAADAYRPRNPRLTFEHATSVH
jgi:3-hydroxypropanoate dehydrogenase